MDVQDLQDHQDHKDREERGAQKENLGLVVLRELMENQVFLVSQVPQDLLGIRLTLDLMA